MVINDVMQKKVSVIIPCYNQGKYIKEAIDSVLNQTYKNIEIVIINDGSTDNSSQIISNLISDKSNIKFIDNKENNGIIYARNFAIDEASGEYILPLDADDIIKPSYIEKAVKILEERSDIGIVYGKVKFFGAKNSIWDLQKFDKEKMIFVNQIVCSALFRKEDFYKAGKYKDYMKKGCEDWDLWLSFIELGLGVYQIDEILFLYRQYKKEEHRSCDVDRVEVLCKLWKNHPNLYFDSEICKEKLFGKTLYNKYVKYKNLYNFFLIVAIFELIVFLIFFLKMHI